MHTPEDFVKIKADLNGTMGKMLRGEQGGRATYLMMEYARHIFRLVLQRGITIVSREESQKSVLTAREMANGIVEKVQNRRFFFQMFQYMIVFLHSVQLHQKSREKRTRRSKKHCTKLCASAIISWHSGKMYSVKPFHRFIETI